MRKSNTQAFAAAAQTRKISTTQEPVGIIARVWNKGAHRHPGGVRVSGCFLPARKFFANCKRQSARPDFPPLDFPLFCYTSFHLVSPRFTLFHLRGKILRAMGARTALSAQLQSRADVGLVDGRAWRDFHAFWPRLLQLVSPRCTSTTLNHAKPRYREKKCVRAEAGPLEELKHRTRNIQRRTSNVPDFQPFGVRCSMFSVGCSAFSLSA